MTLWYPDFFSQNLKFVLSFLFWVNFTFFFCFKDYFEFFVLIFHLPFDVSKRQQKFFVLCLLILNRIVFNSTKTVSLVIHYLINSYLTIIEEKHLISSNWSFWLFVVNSLILRFSSTCQKCVFSVVSNIKSFHFFYFFSFSFVSSSLSPPSPFLSQSRWMTPWETPGPGFTLSPLSSSELFLLWTSSSVPCVGKFNHWRDTGST